MKKVGIIGASGFAGEELVKFLNLHNASSLIAVSSRELKGQNISNFVEGTNLTFVDPDDDIFFQCDVIFFATPHGVSMEKAKYYLENGIKVIDLSADFRLKNPETWKKWYGTEHTDLENLEESVYGLTELNAKKIRDAKLIAVPGCYPTASILGLAPLMTSGSNIDSITIDAATFRTQLVAQKALTGNPVVSIGVYQGMYTQFETYVRTYFGYFGGFASLFTNSTNFDISTNFDVSGMYDLLTASGETAVDGALISDLSGSVTISNITELLRYAVDTNLFSNRDPSGESHNDSDASFGIGVGNFGIRDGFIADDLIFLREGTTIILKLDIAQEAYLPINNLNQGSTNTFLSALGTSQSNNFVQTTSSADLANNFTMSTTASLNNITRTLKAPLLLRLANLSGADSNGRGNGLAFGTSS